MWRISVNTMFFFGKSVFFVEFNTLYILNGVYLHRKNGVIII